MEADAFAANVRQNPECHKPEIRTHVKEVASVSEKSGDHRVELRPEGLREVRRAGLRIPEVNPSPSSLVELQQLERRKQPSSIEEHQQFLSPEP